MLLCYCYPGLIVKTSLDNNIISVTLILYNNLTKAAIRFKALFRWLYCVTSVLSLDNSVLILSLSLGEVSRSKLTLTMIFAFPLVKIVQSDSLTFHTRQHLRIRRQMAVVAYRR